MASGKKSFVLYCDLIYTIEKMPDEKAGQLFKHILAYVNDQNPTTNDLIIELTFEPIKQQLKRDLEKWETEIKPKRTESGRLGGLKSGEARRSKRKQKEANASQTKQTEANEAVNVNDNVITKVINIYGLEFSNYVSQWLKYKSERKEKYKTDESVLLFCKKLSDLSNGQLKVAKEIIETSIANKWAGIFELKQNPKLDDRNKTDKIIFY